MTYIELIDLFWEKNQVSPFSTTEIAFYFYLLQACKSSGWENPLRLPTRKICFELDFRKDTITYVRNSLKQRGLIDFKKGDRRTSDPEYSILDGNGVLVEIADQSPYQNVDQNVDQNAYQSERKEAKERDNIIIPNINSNELSLLDNAREEEKKPKRKRAEKDPEVVRLNREARELFCNVYNEKFDAVYVWGAADAGQMTSLLNHIRVSRSERSVPLPVDTDSMLSALRDFLMSINDDWILGNFSVKIIASKYNEIISRIKMEKRYENNIAGQSDRRGKAVDESFKDVDYKKGF